MYTLPSRRQKKKRDDKLNLVPILDSVFILIFFLLLSAQFIKLFEINSNVPIVSSKSPPPPKSKKEPLSLTVEMKKTELVFLTGNNQIELKKFLATPEGDYPFVEVHNFLIELKKKHIDEHTIIFEPDEDIEYEKIVKLMDAVRLLEKTDESIYKKDEIGNDVPLEFLFDDIIFGNITS